jgi:hypothetical protein
MPQTDAGPVAIVRPVAHASWTAGVPALAYGTSALPGLIPALRVVVMDTSGAQASEHVSRRIEAALLPQQNQDRARRRHGIVIRVWRSGIVTADLSHRSPPAPGFLRRGWCRFFWRAFRIVLRSISAVPLSGQADGQACDNSTQRTPGLPSMRQRRSTAHCSNVGLISASQSQGWRICPAGNLNCEQCVIARGARYVLAGTSGCRAWRRTGIV